MRFIGDDGIKQLFSILAQDFEVWGVNSEGRWAPIKEVDLSLPKGKLPLKEAYLPQVERILRYEGNQMIEEFYTGKIAVFGARPCDIKGVELIGLTFLGEPEDPYFKRRREESFVVGVGCPSPADTCFCKSMGTGPFDTAGMDIRLIPQDGGWLCEGITDRGKAVVERLTAEERDVDLNEMRTKAEEKVSSVNAEGVYERLKGAYDIDLWDRLGERCLGCGVCTFVCPTCYCFDIRDVAVKQDKGERLRLWDSCMFPMYTLETSGHNPRPTQRERMRQRIMHKFAYYPELYGEYGCTGCGRCVIYCPAGIDVRETISEIRSAK